MSFNLLLKTFLEDKAGGATILTHLKFPILFVGAFIGYYWHTGQTNKTVEYGLLILEAAFLGLYFVTFCYLLLTDKKELHSIKRLSLEANKLTNEPVIENSSINTQHSSFSIQKNLNEIKDLIVEQDTHTFNLTEDVKLSV